MPVTIMMYLLLVVVGLAVLAVVALIAKVADGNAPSEIESAHAQVLGVREIAASGATQHWIAFRFSDGHQRELLATPSQADPITASNILAIGMRSRMYHRSAMPYT